MSLAVDDFGAKSRLAVLLKHFSHIEDLRDVRRVYFPLAEVLLLVVCGTMADCDDYENVAGWGEAHRPGTGRQRKTDARLRMARSRFISTLKQVAVMIGENHELIEEMTANSDNISEGELVYVSNSTEGLTENGIDELQNLLTDLRTWHGGVSGISCTGVHNGTKEITHGPTQMGQWVLIVGGWYKKMPQQ